MPNACERGAAAPGDARNMPWPVRAPQDSSSQTLRENGGRLFDERAHERGGVALAQ